MKLQNRVVLVTGASKGIGRAIALGLARAGADVVVNFNRDKRGAAATVKAIEQLGQKALALQADIARVTRIRRMFEEIVAQFGHLDVLVNNAGVTGWTPLFETTEEQWDQVIATNLKGTFFCSLEAARLMKEQDGGSIINISSNVAELGVKHLVAYAASKGGIHALTRQLAVELAPYKIRVNTFGPGPTKVDRNLQDDPAYDRHWGSMVPLGRAAEADEMVGPAVFLASNASSYVTGQIFFVDGGWTAQGKIPEENLDRAARKNQ
ncbi:MAG: 3-oxoacyl-ACP reductase FabG [Verrucomicrobiales bacterium]|nr:3-oxoacyl-ACP reductase FabG [Verrucomicrobiales bacterium]